jgi:transcriptional regulator with XRE-family HTH domain
LTNQHFLLIKGYAKRLFFLRKGFLMHETWECFQAGIRALRDHGWQTRPQKELAEETGYTATHISQVFQGKRRAGSKLQAALAKEYGMQVEDVIKIGRQILDGAGFFPFIGQIDDLPAHSEDQARRIIALTNRVYGIEGVLLSYCPGNWADFLQGTISAAEFYRGYAQELDLLIRAVEERKKIDGGSR